MDIGQVLAQIFGTLFAVFVSLAFISANLCILCAPFAMIGGWIYVLVDCLKNEPSNGNDKIVWVLVTLLGGPMGALIYWFVRRPQRKQQIGQ